MVNTDIVWNIADKMDFFGIISKSSRKLLKKDKFGITCLQIHITSDCNLDCKYCYAKNHKGDSISKIRIKELIDEAKKLGVHEIQFVGGEPFRHPHLQELIDLTAANGMRLRIYTNGLLIDDNWINQNKNKDVILAIKYDSTYGYKKHIGKDYHDEISAVVNKVTEKGIFVNTFIAVTKNNVQDIDSLVKKSFEIGAFPIIERYLPCSGNNNLEINDTEWNLVLEVFDQYYKNLLPKFRMISKVLNHNCSCYGSTLSIDTNGEAVPCPYAPKELSMGNINETDLKTIFDKYKNNISKWNAIPDDCVGCKEVKLCKGGCKTYVFLKTGSFDKKDDLCKGRAPNKTMLAFNK